MSRSGRPVPPINQLADELVADIMGMSDAELLAEIEAEGLNAEDEADRKGKSTSFPSGIARLSLPGSPTMTPS